MKKVFLSIILVASAQLLQATVWTVSFDTRPAQFTNLQVAVDTASAGDTILINGYQSGYSSTYIKKPLVLMGEKMDEPGNNSNNSLTNPYPTSRVYRIYLGRLNSYTGADGTKIYGLAISYLYLHPDFTGAQAGQTSLDDILIERCQLDQVNFDSYYRQFSNITFRNTVFTNRINGLGKYYSQTSFSNILFTNCVFSNAYIDGDGYSLAGNVVVRNSVFINRTANNCFSNIKGLIVENNVFYRSEPGGCTDCTYNNNLTYLCNDNTLPPSSGNSVGSGNIEGVDPQWLNYPAQGAVGWTQYHDYSSSAGSPVLGTGTNGTNIGLMGGNAPVANVPVHPKNPEVIEVDIPVSSVPAGGTLQINLKAKTRD